MGLGIKGLDKTPDPGRRLLNPMMLAMCLLCRTSGGGGGV